jgi:uncharacterized protein (DUF1778 family)
MPRRLIDLVVRARRLVARVPESQARGRSRVTARRQLGNEVTQFSFRLALVIDLAYVGIGALGGAAVGRASATTAPAATIPEPSRSCPADSAPRSESDLMPLAAFHRCQYVCIDTVGQRAVPLFRMPTKSDQLQIRVSTEQKRRLKQLARAAGMDVSTWVLSRVLPSETERFQQFVAAVAASTEDATRRLHLAELADFLRALPAGAFRRAVAEPPRAQLDPALRNHLAGTIELAANRRGQPAPAWTREVPASPEPAFGSSLTSLRLYLLTRAPVALRRRNLFMDASIDDRV